MRIAHNLIIDHYRKNKKMPMFRETEEFSIFSIMSDDSLTIENKIIRDQVEVDLKKLIAYSTCSQLGYMLAACGLSKYGLAFFHLFTHGFFKALLFLCAGGILHGMHDDQDLRRMGALGSRTSFLYVILLIGSLALTGFPFLSGFYSKELIILSTIYDIVPF